MPRPPSFLRPLLSGDAGRCHVVIDGVDAPLATAVEPAFDSATRKRGLLGRDGLAAGAALVIAPCNAVHTFGMQFPIDVIFAARDGQVLKIRKAVPARRLAGSWKAYATIEMAAGSADAAGLVPGQRLRVVTERRAETASTRSDRSSS